MNAVLPWLDARRAEAIGSFRATGLPHRRIEEWKYSDLRAALGETTCQVPVRRNGRSATLPKAWKSFDLAKLDRAGMGARRIWAPSRRECDERRLAGALRGRRCAARVAQASLSPSPLDLDISRHRPCARADGAGRGRLAHPDGAPRVRQRLPQYRHRKSSLGRNAQLSQSCAHCARCRCACRWKRSMPIARRALSRPFRQFRRQAFAPGMDDRAGRPGCRGHLSRR